MDNQRTHHVTTTDGVTIGGTVHGQGRPLVFFRGMLADGDTDWQALLPHLTGRFTCHLPSLRGRGLSGDHSDLSPGRIVDDILAYVDSIEKPTGLVGWSSGAYLAIVAAAQSDALDAVAPFEPGVLSLMDEQEQAVFGGAAVRMGDPRRRARRPPDPSRGARRGTHRVLRTSPEAGLTLAQRGPVAWPDPPARSARRYVPLSLEGSYASRDRANFTSSLI